jgi:hypothetical protein
MGVGLSHGRVPVHSCTSRAFLNIAYKGDQDIQDCGDKTYTVRMVEMLITKKFKLLSLNKTTKCECVTSRQLNLIPLTERVQGGFCP